MVKTKIGIIGCGKQAPKHISGYRKLNGMELVLADVNLDAARKLAKQESIPYVENTEDLFNDPLITAVDVCTPTSTHVELIEKALSSGKHFFCEKPLCETAAEARYIKKAMERHDCIGMVGHIYRFVPVFEKAQRQFLQDVRAKNVSAQLGDIITAYFRIGGRGDHRVWKHLKSCGGGALREMMVHMLDLAIWFFGQVEEVEVISCDQLRKERIIQGKKEQVDAEDFILTVLKMENGIRIYCQADMVTPAFTQFVEIQGVNGTFMGSINPDVSSYLFLNEPTDGFKQGKTILTTPFVNLFEAQMAEFVTSIKTHSQPPRGNIHDSVFLLEAIDKIKNRMVE